MISISKSAREIWRQTTTPGFLVVFIAIWSAVVMFSALRYGDLSGYDDAAYAHQARAMVRSGDIWTLRTNGEPDFDKPPLFIWFVALSFRVFGINDFAGKVPVALFGWMTIVLTYFLAKKLFPDKSQTDSISHKWIPVLSMLVMATTQYFLKYSGHVMTDVPFTFFFTLAIFFYVHSTETRPLLLAVGIATGLAALTRSPMGLLPLVIIVLHGVMTHHFRRAMLPYFLGCAFLAILIPTIWYLIEYYSFGAEFIDRHVGNILAHSADDNQLPFWQNLPRYFDYISMIVRLYIPWFPLMFYGIFLAARKLRPPSAAPAELLLLIWIAVVIVPFSLADAKVFRYILPAFPAFAILSAYGLRNLLSEDFLCRFARISVVVLTIIAIAVVIFPRYQIRAEDMRALAPLSDAATAPGDPVVLYTSGVYEWNYKAQLIWYGDRACTHSKEIKDIESILIDKKGTVVIIDKRSFDDLIARTHAKVTVLGESQKFVCFRA